MVRDTWGSRAGFVLAAAGSAVGLGNIWKFPYLAGENGGGAFLIVYLGLVLTLGLSVMLAEVAIGRAAQRAPVGAYRALTGPRWALAGWMGVAAGFLILSFYSVVGGWTLAYVVRTASGAFAGQDAAALEGAFGAFIGDPGPAVGWHAAFMLLTALVVWRGVAGGIERAARVLMPLLFLLLIGLIGWSLTLPGAFAGAAFVLAPDFGRIDGGVVSDAMAQAFFSLSLGMGTMITYGSYLNKRENLPRAAVSVVVLDTVVAILAGLLIMPAVFAFGFDPGAGPGLTFITLPAVFAEMPGGTVFGMAFFVLLAIAALTSAVSLLEVPVSHLVDNTGLGRPAAVAVVATIIFALGVPSALSVGGAADISLLGMTFFDAVDWLTSKIMLPIGGIVACLVVGWVAWPRVYGEATNDGAVAFRLAVVWRWLCAVVAPAAVAWILIAGLVG